MLEHGKHPDLQVFNDATFLVGEKLLEIVISHFSNSSCPLPSYSLTLARSVVT